MATILSVFDISLPIDERGQPVMPDLEYGDGIVRFHFESPSMMHFSYLG